MIALTPIPGNFTCGYCMENPALPHQAWCAVCAPIVDQYPAEPIERRPLIPVEDWDTYSITYRLPTDPEDERPVTDIFAAESADAATSAVRDRHPGATITAVINITGGGDIKWSAK